MALRLSERKLFAERLADLARLVPEGDAQLV